MLDEVLFIEGEKDYVKFHLEKDNTITSLINMKKIEGYFAKARISTFPPLIHRPHVKDLSCRQIPHCLWKGFHS